MHVERKREKGDRQSDSNGKRDLSSSCGGVRSVEATVRAEIGTSASHVMDVSLHDC